MKKVGEVWVDSGQVMITDPCYLKAWKDNEFTYEENQAEPKDTSYTYNGACHVTCYTDEHAGEIKSPGGNAVVSSSGYGDGSYPVYAEYEDGRVKSLTIEFF